MRIKEFTRSRRYEYAVSAWYSDCDYFFASTGFYPTGTQFSVVDPMGLPLSRVLWHRRRKGSGQWNCYGVVHYADGQPVGQWRSYGAARQMRRALARIRGSRS